MDPERWRKKFRFLFQREQILSFAHEGQSEKIIQVFNRRGLASSLEPLILKPGLGAWLLNQSAVFWILFAQFNRQRIESDIDSKERVRRQIVDAFWNSSEDNIEESCRSNHVEDVQVPEQDQLSKEKRIGSQRLLKAHLDRLLYLPEVGSGCEDKHQDVLNQTLVIERNDDQTTPKDHYEEFKQISDYPSPHANDFRIESEIAPNLQEIQQEEEIICMDEGWQKHHMTFAEENEKDDGSSYTPNNIQNILNKSFICDEKQVDITAKFQQDYDDYEQEEDNNEVHLGELAQKQDEDMFNEEEKHRSWSQSEEPLQGIVSPPSDDQQMMPVSAIMEEHAIEEQPALPPVDQQPADQQMEQACHENLQTNDCANDHAPPEEPHASIDHQNMNNITMGNIVDISDAHETQMNDEQIYQQAKSMEAGPESDSKVEEHTFDAKDESVAS